MKLLAELKRRNVFRVVATYIVAAWLLLQVTDVLTSVLGLPPLAGRFVFLLLVIGFIPTVVFAWAYQMTPEGLKRDTGDAGASVETARNLDRATIAMLVVVAGLVVFDRFLPAKGEKGSEPFSAESTDAAGSPSSEKGSDPFFTAAPEQTSIAVLPFVNMSPDPEQEYFSDGISEEILNAVAQVQELRVAGRTSSFAFKGQNEDLRSIGQKLGVSHILEGSVRKSGDRVRITAQLIHVEDGFHLWSETFDRQLTDVFAIQDEISLAVLEALKAQLVGDRSIHATPVDLAVYDKYLLARQKMRERDEAPLLEAAALLDEVIAADPSYAPALAQRGITELLLATTIGTYGSIPVEVAVTNGRRWLEEAARLDPGLPDALAGLGLAHRHRAELPEAISLLNQALALNPSYIDASNWLQQVYFYSGRLAEAGQLAQRIHELDPLYLPAFSNLTMLHMIRGENDKAVALVQEGERLFDGSPPAQVRAILALAARFDRREAEAIQLTRKLENWQRNFGSYAGFDSYFALMEYEAAGGFAEQFPPQMIVLGRLGRHEEAMQLAMAFVPQRQAVDLYIAMLSQAGEYERIIDYVENQWSNLDELTKAYNGTGFGVDMLGHIAHAYRVEGQEQGFTDALRRMREILDDQAAQGASNIFHSWSNAHYYMLAGDEESALKYMEQAIDQGFLEDADFTRWWSAFRPLRGEPRFETLVARMNARRNEQRALLGLPPIGANA